MLKHLARRDAIMRRGQAEGLREWAKTQSLPIIAMGDFNFDYDFHTEKGNEAFSVSCRIACGSGSSRSRRSIRIGLPPVSLQIPWLPCRMQPKISPLWLIPRLQAHSIGLVSERRRKN